MMDIKTILIALGLIFVLWSCAGMDARLGAIDAAGATLVPDPATCYSQIHGAVRDDWAQLNEAQRLLIGMKSIKVCEGQP